MRSLIGVLGLLMALGAARADDVPAPYTLPDTEVVPLHSDAIGADYRLYISLPQDYIVSSRSFPVVYMLDADYSFALVRSVVKHFVDRNNLPPLILVALAYPGADRDQDLYHRSRTRDYTPTFVAGGGYGPESQKLSGGAAKFADFLAETVIPLMEERYHAAKSDRTIVGHSFGGLFGAYVLATRPQLFQRYILVSPSLWYDDGVIFRLLDKPPAPQALAKSHVFLAVGALEDPEMSSDLAKFEGRLLASNGGPPAVDLHVFEDETHNSVFPGAVTRGLLKVFGTFPARSAPAATK